MQKLSRFFSDYAPMASFLLVYLSDISLGINFVPEGAIYQSTAAMIIITLVSLPIILIIDRKISNKHIILSILIIIFGGATIYFNDDSYLKIKPTIFYLLTACILLVGLRFDRLFLKSLFAEALDMDNQPWRIFTFRFILFFLMMAGLNELIWRSFSTDLWVSFKFFGAIPMIFIFMLLNIPFLKDNVKNDVLG